MIFANLSVSVIFWVEFLSEMKNSLMKRMRQVPSAIYRTAKRTSSISLKPSSLGCSEAVMKIMVPMQKAEIILF